MNRSLEIIVRAILVTFSAHLLDFKFRMVRFTTSFLICITMANLDVTSLRKINASICQVSISHSSIPAPPCVSRTQKPNNCEQESQGFREIPDLMVFVLRGWLLHFLLQRIGIPREIEQIHKRSEG